MDNLQRENWTSRLGFILAAAGSAVGLGNIWRFPYVAGTNGGAAFLVLYLIAIVLIGYPVMVTEMTIGRKTQKNPVGAFKSLAPDAPWWLVGALGVFTGFVILSFYSVVGGWSMAYVVKAANGFIAGTDFGEVFVGHISGVGEPLLWHATFMFLTITIIGSGVVKGIQKAVEVLMPILFVLLLILVFRAITLPGAGEGLAFYLTPDFSQITGQTFLEAIGQSFFTLSLGMGAIITYGSYLSDDDNINDNAAYVAGFDTLIAILAGFAIFPAVFALGFSPDAGPGLVFTILPAVFAEMPLGTIFGFLFFLLLTISAITSAISLLEVVVAYVVDEHQWNRKKAAWLAGIIIFIVGIPPLLGYSTLAEVNFLGMDILDTYDWISGNIFLPLGGLLTAVFAGYAWGARETVEEANKVKGAISVGAIYSFLIKYLVPIAIFIVLVTGVWETIAG
ncbi:sodium-dependent transporter [Fuchsiella alkaliacetigena]|uniref:sodium-dependent transporter n=1 Tax=Fuchsiella alkaliacetigena TaxID=957042 RepID=UPI00200AE0A4|nr:sodium-dependent transporter [Fuchsiella alkaliacetigena]MCK8824654.1 sodium-dependent transporter [Fuchsiella alkaliacetigena]